MPACALCYDGPKSLGGGGVRDGRGRRDQYASVFAYIERRSFVVRMFSHRHIQVLEDVLQDSSSLSFFVRLRCTWCLPQWVVGVGVVRGSGCPLYRSGSREDTTAEDGVFWKYVVESFG